MSHVVGSPCPLCGSSLSVESVVTVEVYHPGYHVRGTPLPERERHTEAVACAGCEFMLDLRNPDGTHKPASQLIHEVGQAVAEKEVAHGPRR